MAAWRCFANDININAWGKAFKWAKNGSKRPNIPSTMTGINGETTNSWDDTAELILNTFFPAEGDQTGIARKGPLNAYHKEVDANRVKAAIWRMSPKKAPGPDGLTAQILRKTWPVLGQEITNLFERCIREATFTESWKEAKLVVIPKPGKEDLASPKSFRPISLLPVLGKALETLIIQNLVEETELDTYEQQHGFVAGRSTITAIRELYEWTKDNKCRHVMGAFLDITGAFDNVKWSSVLSRLQDIGSSLRTLRIVQSYLQDRASDLTWKDKITKGTWREGAHKDRNLGLPYGR